MSVSKQTKIYLHQFYLDILPMAEAMRLYGAFSKN